MLRKRFWIPLLLLLVIAGYLGGLLLLPDTAFSSKTKYLYIRTNQATYSDLLKTLQDSQYLKSPRTFNFLARRMGLEEKIKAGRYEIRKGMSVLDVVRMLRNGRQSPVNLVITKLRTREDLASLLGRKFECDSTSVIDYLSQTDSLKKYQLDTSNFMTGIFPNTYELFWNSTPAQIFKKLFEEKERYWTPERTEQATAHKITPTQAYILASIIEEETRDRKDKDTMASVYLNRFHSGMPLQADPTVKFALRNFTLKRIYNKHTEVISPYNTYRVKGLPPGPICTPSAASMEAVLNAPSTNYFYFVAKSDFSGRHVFSVTYDEHLLHAREFQDAQNQQEKIKAAQETEHAKN